MSNQPNSTKHAFGWRDFDQEVVEGLVENDSRFINRRSNGWIASPLVGHYDNKLAWKDDNFKKGSMPAGDPPASFRAAPTYVLERPLDNFIAGRELIADAVAGCWGHPEASRLGNETSVGALTWNVLRSLQEVDRLRVVAGALAATEIDSEPELGFWGRLIGRAQAEPWPELVGAPDACLRVPGWGWVLIDARFGGGTDTLADAVALETWLEQYSSPAPGLFDDEALRRVRVKDLPHRTLETIAFAHHLKATGDRRSSSLSYARASPSSSSGGSDAASPTQPMSPSAAPPGSRSTPPSTPTTRSLAPLRDYIENKSYGLRPAFSLHGGDDDAGSRPRSGRSPSRLV